MKNQYIVIFITAKDKKQADQISKELLAKKLIACANIVTNIHSFFRWQGSIDSSKEVLLVLKTKKSLFKKIEAQVKLLHSYKVPEIIALPIVAGSKDYLDWIEGSVL